MAEEGGVGKQGRTEEVLAPVYADEEGNAILGEIDPEEVRQVAEDFATIVRRVGGVCTFVARRVEVDDGQFKTERMIFHWSSRAPAERKEAEAKEPAPRPQLKEDVEEAREPEPAVAG